MNNEVLKCLEERRSIRVYKDEQIKPKELDAILRAGIYAPSGMNRQTSVLAVFQDKDTVKKLSALNSSFAGGRFADPFYGAPTVIMVLGDSRVYTYLEDGALTMGNLMNAAHAVGVDSCWIHRAKEMAEDTECRELLRSMGIGDEYVGIGCCILGYRDCAYPEPRPRRENRIFIHK
ncbi:MAG: nitroreductase [Oscillospiraceae bacterium]|nr:nitroreductase [Oscillospiraceae bacterium]